ncbi:MAG: Nre family DNA repair protein [Candidatus Methanofastidiosia archaeon]
MYPLRTDKCALCKGYKLLCKRPLCPILEKVRIRRKVSPKLSREIFGSSPSAIFVGSWNYPKVYIGPLVPPVIGDTSEMDRPDKWFEKSLEEIVEFRAFLVRSKESIHVNAARDPTRDILLTQEIVMSDKPVDTELLLTKRPSFHMNFSEFSPPFGPSEMIEKLDLAQNPHVPSSVEKVAGDELSAREGILELYRKDIETPHISKIFSAGILGAEKKRKFVPTRWSITATDDIVSKNLMKNIREYPQLSEFEVFYAEGIGNKLAVVLMPGIWSFEFFECWLPGSIFLDKKFTPQIYSDWEYFKDRKSYADVIEGAYYAGRLPVTEYLDKIKRQASSIVFLEVDPSYHTPIGVWRVRTILREAFNGKPKKFDSRKDAFEEVGRFLAVPIDGYVKSSQLLNFTSRQKVLDEWF